MSPLVAYAGSGWMPLPALYAVAAGIALMLMLIGRRLHGVLLADVLAERRSTSAWLVAAAMMLLGIFLVLLGVVVTLLILVRGQGPKIPV